MSTSVHLPEDADATFSLGLTHDQRDIRDWVDGFVESVVRPAAPESEKRKGTPWPVVEQTARIGAVASAIGAGSDVVALRTTARCDELGQGTSEIRLVIARAITGLQIA